MKDALWLTRFELKCIGIWQAVLLITLLSFIIYLFRSEIIQHDFQVSRILDSIFILSFIFIPDVIRPKGFPSRKITGPFYASPTLLHLQMLPIPKRVIALYRFFIQFILSNLLVLITFLSLYDLLKHGIGMMSYVGCAFFWSCLVGMYQ